MPHIKKALVLVTSWVARSFLFEVIMFLVPQSVELQKCSVMCVSCNGLAFLPFAEKLCTDQDQVIKHMEFMNNDGRMLKQGCIVQIYLLIY